MIQNIIENLIAYHSIIGYNNSVSITFHGGEPLLLGHEFFLRALKYLRNIEEQKRIKLSLAIQTNLTLLDNEYCKIFQEHNVGISTSIDGPSYLHNRFRGRSHIDDNHFSVMKNIELARQYGLRLGAICIITPDKLSYVQDIYDFFKQHKINFKTNVPFLHGCALENHEQVYVDLDEYAKFLIALFDIWYPQKPEVMIENLLDLISIALRGTGAGGCANSNCSIKHITITPDGECYTCGRTTGDPFFNYGNIKSITFDEISKNSKFLFFNNRVPDNIPSCSICHFKNACFSGCMYEAYLQSGTIYAPDKNCKAFKTVYSHIYERVKTDLIELQRKES